MKKVLLVLAFLSAVQPAEAGCFLFFCSRPHHHHWRHHHYVRHHPHHPHHQHRPHQQVMQIKPIEPAGLGPIQ
jgi:hypothetical protein